MTFSLLRKGFLYFFHLSFVPAVGLGFVKHHFKTKRSWIITTHGLLICCFIIVFYKERENYFENT